MHLQIDFFGSAPPPERRRHGWQTPSAGDMGSRFQKLPMRQPLIDGPACKHFRLGHVFRRVCVEEGVDRRRRPVHTAQPVPLGPLVDFSDLLPDKGMPEIVTKRDAPQTDHRMHPVARRRYGEVSILIDTRGLQATNKIARKKWAIPRGAHDPFDIRPVGGRPIERCKHAGQRPREFQHGIGNDRQAERAEPRGVAVALRTSSPHCGASRSITRLRIVRPPISRNGLSPPPSRRARPPASTAPTVGMICSSRSPSLCAASLGRTEPARADSAIPGWRLPDRPSLLQVDADDVLYSPRATLVARHHDTEPIGGKQRFAVAFIRQQDLRVAEVRRDLAEGNRIL